MTFTLMNNSSENNAVTKSVTTLQTLTGTLKNATSILEPSIIVTGLISTIITMCNYAYIPEFGRYYFVKDIKSIKNDVWEISCHVDVLATYAAQIREQKAVIKRQEHKYNLYLDDGIFKTYQNPDIITKNFPSGFGSTKKFILAVAGG